MAQHHMHGLLIAAAVSIVAICGLVILPGKQIAGAITLSDQATYEIALEAYNRCDPQVNPVIDSTRLRTNCCSNACFTPCMTSGLAECQNTCKTVCQGKPIYKAGE